MKHIIIGLLLIFVCGCSSKKKANVSLDEIVLDDEKEVAEDVPAKTTAPSKAEVEKKELDTKKKNEDADRFAEQYRVLKESKNISEANRAAATILSEDPKNLRALNGLAMHYYRQQLYSMARRILSRAFQQAPENAELLNNLGLVLLKENKDRDAMAAFKKALKMDPKNVAANENLGTMYAQSRDYSKAYPLLVKAFRKNRNDLHLMNNLAVTLMHLRKIKSAKLLFTKKLSASDDPNLKYNYAYFLIEHLNDNQLGLEVLKKIDVSKLQSRYVSRVRVLEKKAMSRLK